MLAGRLFFNLATQIQGIAVGWQVYALTQDPLMLGLIGLAEALPSIAVALYAGHIADLIDRRKIVLTAVALFSLSLLLLTIAATVGIDKSLLLIAIFSIVAITGITRGFYNPAIFGMVADIVPRASLGNAAAWNSSFWQGASMLGPVLGGFLYVNLHAANTYLCSTVLLFLSLLTFTFIETRTTIKEKTTQSVSENIKEGLAFVFNNQVMLGAMAMDLFAVLFGGAVALLPIFSKEIFKMGPEALGVLRAAPFIGSLLMVSSLTHRPINKNAGAIFMASVAGFGLCMIGFALSTNFYLSLILLALSGALDGVSVYVRSTIYQLLTPDDMKGRVASVNSIFIGSSNEIGEFESGIAAKVLGLTRSVVFGGSMTLLVVLLTAWKAPKLRKLHIDSLIKQTP